MLVNYFGTGGYLSGLSPLLKGMSTKGYFHTIRLTLYCYLAVSCINTPSMSGRSGINSGLACLQQVCSFGIIARQVGSLWTELFTSPCEACLGAGSLICKHCHGSKIRRKFLKIYKKKNNDHPSYKYECYHCGPYCPNDFKYENTPDDLGTLNIMANLKNAMCNRARPHPFPATAGENESWIRCLKRVGFILAMPEKTYYFSWVSSKHLYDRPL